MGLAEVLMSSAVLLTVLFPATLGLGHLARVCSRWTVNISHRYCSADLTPFPCSLLNMVLSLHIPWCNLFILFLYLFLGYFPRNLYPFKRSNCEGPGVGWHFLRRTFGSKTNRMMFHWKTNLVVVVNAASLYLQQGSAPVLDFSSRLTPFFPEHFTARTAVDIRAGEHHLQKWESSARQVSSEAGQSSCI